MGECAHRIRTLFDNSGRNNPHTQGAGSCAGWATHLHPGNVCAVIRSPHLKPSRDLAPQQAGAPRHADSAPLIPTHLYTSSAIF